MLSTPIASYEIVNAYPHDPLAFTQGLLFADGFLYESTGLYGQSTVRQVNLETGEVVRETHLSPDLFGEGLTLHDGCLIQLTWQSRIGLVYNLVSFDTMSPTTFTYPTEGWGLTTDGHLLIMSDGTATLRYLHPMTFNLVREQDVWTEQGVVTMLNELEYVHGEIWANVWQTERIARIDPTTGRVKAWIDLSGLTQRMSGGAQVDVLNGIAHDADQDRIFVTGKLWPAVFEIRVVE
ncbi:MAG: glutaminyl-peptide cyclotransferase [Chloroflexi bacterium]|nr:glutaminyl-peptide cyclotransferase [Chloroflexota bacterium]